MFKPRTAVLALIILTVFIITSLTTSVWANTSRDGIGQALNQAADYLWQKEKNKGILSPWSYIALAAAGQDLKGTQADQVCEKMLAAAAQSGEMNDYATLVLTILAAGGTPDNYQGQNLVKKIQDAQLADGKFADNLIHGGEQLLNAHIWAILALHAAGAEVPEKNKALEWLVAQQHANGSFYWDVKNKEISDVDSTGMALMALGALGEKKDSPAVQKAVAYLQSAQKENGGFESWGAENPESCRMVIEGLTAVGLDPTQGILNKTGGNPLTALLHFQLPDGSFEHIVGTGSNEMATHQALMALTCLHYGQTFYERLRDKAKSALLRGEPGVSRREVRFVVGTTNYTVVTNGRSTLMTTDTAPFIENGRIFVPVRYLASALGVADNDIVWDEKTQTVKLTMGGVTVRLVIGESTIYINDQARAIEVAPQIRNSRTCLPARFVAEAFGYQVGWDAASETVSITN